MLTHMSEEIGVQLRLATERGQAQEHLPTTPRSAALRGTRLRAPGYRADRRVARLVQIAPACWGVFSLPSHASPEAWLIVAPWVPYVLHVQSAMYFGAHSAPCYCMPSTQGSYYSDADSSIGKQHVSKRTTLPSFGFGTAPRSPRKVLRVYTADAAPVMNCSPRLVLLRCQLYLSAQHAANEPRLESQDATTCNTRSALGKQVRSTRPQYLRRGLTACPLGVCCAA